MIGRYQKIAGDNESLIGCIESQEQRFLVMARRLQDRVSDLPNEERRQSKTHRFG